MNIGYFLFALGVVGVVLWGSSFNANADDAQGPRLQNRSACVQTSMGDIAVCE